MSRANDGPRALGETLRQMAMRYRKVDLAAIDVVRQRWAGLVTEPVATHCEPLEVRDRTLVVGVPNGAFAERVRLESRRILEGLHDLGASAPTEVRAAVRGSR